MISVKFDKMQQHVWNPLQNSIIPACLAFCLKVSWEVKVHWLLVSTEACYTLCRTDLCFQIPPFGLWSTKESGLKDPQCIMSPLSDIYPKLTQQCCHARWKVNVEQKSVFWKGGQKIKIQWSFFKAVNFWSWSTYIPFCGWVPAELFFWEYAINMTPTFEWNCFLFPILFPTK